MSRKALLTELTYFKTVERRVGQIEALLIAIEHAVEAMDETSLGLAISGVRSLNNSLYSELESMKVYESQQCGTTNAGATA
ncbi:hypothetical protein KC222_11955 [Cedecea davisae]|uniref:Uncharacterized protein n=1 Tax=Cedecea davisae TaxID=158484 RepID=A0ABS6DHT4_9ENTR|nr:hypothetical protein [Cedecea davisae]MBU4682727.1 hypothetical protein [Cedecea davisae]MBU4686287.1 hypothetical protein [Cedecea davisae]